MLWDRHAPALRCTLRHLLGPKAEVEEALHQVFLRLSRRIDRLRDPGLLRVFLVGIAVEVVTPKLRRAHLGRWLRRSESKSDSLTRHYALLSQLAAADRTAFVLRYLDGLQPGEIAEAMQCDLRTVSRCLARSTKQLLASIRRSEGSQEDDHVLLMRFQDLALGDLDGEVSDIQAGEGRERLAQSLSKPDDTRRKPLGLRLLVACSALIAVASGAYLIRSIPGSLSCAVDGAGVGAGGYVRGAPGSGSRIEFSDGSAVELADGARGRIAAVNRNGARIALESGHALVRVAARPSAEWAVDAGPFVLNSNGTEAFVDWSASDEVLEVALHQGSLTISGPPAPGGLVLHAGQRLVAAAGRLQVEPL
jgi:RNA polymerase sigma factor (sigma-70 family)